ncbi:Protein phosphatase 2C 37 [Hibiscus syriacus]|uniref:protein-serine/threonine phosphatase n=1 Tax=Hibiscus syriacus TaxID=106335 RepID=A0A6A2Z025_HIBSY|nr:Protein phosphatase 2C 37 [Hibiscus syriacus]
MSSSKSNFTIKGSSTVSTSRRRESCPPNIQYLDFNFTVKNIQVKAQLHDEGAIRDFNSTTEDIVPTHPQFKLHDGGYCAIRGLNFTTKGLPNFRANFNFTTKDIGLKTAQAQLHSEGAADCQQTISPILETISTSRRRILDSEQYNLLGFQLHDEGYPITSLNSTTEGLSTVSTSRRRESCTQADIGLETTQLLLDFNFTTKDIQFKAQLHNEGAIHGFDFTTKGIVPTSNIHLQEQADYRSPLRSFLSKQRVVSLETNHSLSQEELSANQRHDEFDLIQLDDSDELLSGRIFKPKSLNREEDNGPIPGRSITVMSEGEASAPPCEPSSRQVRRCRMAFRRFKFVDFAPSEAENSRKRHKFQACCCDSATVGFHYFGVYDGHGCFHVAIRCRERLHGLMKKELESEDEEWKGAMQLSFRRMDREGIKLKESMAAGANCRYELHSPECNAVGSTVVVAVVTPNKIVVSNCGDSKAVLCRNGIPVVLTSDHKLIDLSLVLV